LCENYPILGAAPVSDPGRLTYVIWYNEFIQKRKDTLRSQLREFLGRDRMKSFYIQVYGCQMNVYDSRKIEDILIDSGYIRASDINIADIVIFYTCHIREKAVSKLFSDIGRVKDKDNKIIAVGGCVAQAEGNNILKNNRHVSIVFGPQTYHNLPMYIEASEKIVDLGFLRGEKFREFHKPIRSFFSEFVSIQEGCDNFCTYCVVPYTRGREYSRPPEEIIDEVKGFIDKGAVEITLIGQNVNSYNHDRYRLERLLAEVSQIAGLKRLRYTTSHPKDFTDDLMKIHRDLKNLIPPFVHIPVQSGSNKILKLMNRGHTVEEYLSKLEKFKRICPEISFSSDFIVGFPGETESDFADTVSLAQKAKFSLFYAFKYSRRKNTPAYNMENQIPENEKEKRLAILLKVLCESQLEFNKKCIGLVQKVLFEKRGKKEGQYVGKSEYIQSVIVESRENLIGSFREVKITHGFQNCLMGDIAI
jgi:tRNA-2-methylthio-N6-dimethylallyladenosine synthase